MKILCLFSILLCVPHLSGCGAHRPIHADVPELESDDDQDEDDTPTQKDLDEAIKEALEMLYAARGGR